MCRAIAFLIINALLALFWGCRTIDDRLENAATKQELLQAAADFYVTDGKDAACAVVLVTTNETLFAFAGECTTNSLFRIASLSKLFLKSALENAVAQGDVKLGTSVGDFFDMPEEFRSITLGELRDNQSGLPRDFIDLRNPLEVWQAFEGGFWGAHIYRNFDTREKFFATCRSNYWRNTLRKNRAQVPRPRIYSNVGYGLLGLCLEKQTGLSLEDFLAKYLTKPLNLHDTTYEPERTGRGARLTRACAGHLPWFIRRGDVVPDIRLGEALRAAGGLFASPMDCGRVFKDYWRIIDAECARLPNKDLVAYDLIGLLRVKHLSEGKPLLYRAGMIYGGASIVCFDLETRSTLIVLRDVTSWPDKRGFKLAQALRHAERTK